MIQIVVDKIQFKRGTTAQRMALVLDSGEPFFDETQEIQYIGDGVTPGGNLPGGSGAGLTQGAADARYIQQTQINAAGGVAGLDAGAFVGETNLPLPPVDLTILLENKLA